jgi:hypothetical protein
VAIAAVGQLDLPAAAVGRARVRPQPEQQPVAGERGLERERVDADAARLAAVGPRDDDGLEAVVGAGDELDRHGDPRSVRAGDHPVDPLAVRAQPPTRLRRPPRLRPRRRPAGLRVEHVQPEVLAPGVVDQDDQVSAGPRRVVADVRVQQPRRRRRGRAVGDATAGLRRGRGLGRRLALPRRRRAGDQQQ